MKTIFTPPHASWTHRLARIMMRPLVGGPVTANHVTTGRLAAGLVACVAFAMGTAYWNIWGGVLWLVSCLLDRADGELARLSGTVSPGGHRYDYYCDLGVNSVLFVAMGFGLRHGPLGGLAPLLGLLVGAAVTLASILSERLELAGGNRSKAYPSVAGFILDDVLYLIAPAAWLGWFFYILVGAAFCAPIVAATAIWRVRAARLGRGWIAGRTPPPE